LGSIGSLGAGPRWGAWGRVCAIASPICAACERELWSAPPLAAMGPPGVEVAIAAAEYRGAARDLALGLKFGRRLGLASAAAAAIAAASPPEHLRGAIVPVPPAPWRWRWRGFDPAEEIALALADLTGLPYEHCLRRAEGPRQVGRPKRDRLAHPPRIRARGRIPAECLLVDDVWTTGATLAACARVLRDGGCERVVALTLAHSP
jgi:predicted amidophosphoribosyltransferase